MQLLDLLWCDSKHLKLTIFGELIQIVSEKELILNLSSKIRIMILTASIRYIFNKYMGMNIPILNLKLKLVLAACFHDGRLWGYLT